MMTLGTTGAFGFEDFHPPEVLGHYARAGCTVVQIYRNRQRDIDPGDIRAVVDDFPMRIDSLHGVFGDDLDPSAEDEAFRRKSIDVYRREADYCQALGGDLVVVHPCPARVAVKSFDLRYSQLRKSFDELADIGERYQMRYAFENMPPYHPIGSDVGRLLTEIRAVDSPWVVFLLDTGHAHMTCGIGESIRLAHRDIKYTHVHDNDGRSDTHSMPYRGNLPWDELRTELHRSEYSGVFLLEVFEKTSDLPQLMSGDWGDKIRRIVDGVPQDRLAGHH